MIVRNRLEPGPDGSLRAVPTGETEVLECGLVLRSVGYRGTPLEGVPFDEGRAVIPNERRARGRPASTPPAGSSAGRAASSARTRRTPTRPSALMLADAAAGLLPSAADPSPDAIEELVAERQPHVVEYAGWEAIDAHERDRGEPHGRPRVKLGRGTS